MARKTRRKKKDNNGPLLMLVAIVLVGLVLVAAIQNSRNADGTELAEETMSQEMVQAETQNGNGGKAGAAVQSGESQTGQNSESAEENSGTNTESTDNADNSEAQNGTKEETPQSDEKQSEEADNDNQSGKNDEADVSDTSGKSGTQTDNGKNNSGTTDSDNETETADVNKPQSADSWTSFDGYTLGSVTNAYGSIYSKEEIAALDGTKQGFGQGVHVDDKNRPTGATMLQEKYGKYGAVYIAEDSSNFYLTFDEGYENGYTSKILDVLKEKNCKAVFFVTMSYVKSNPELMQRMIDEGHVVGNHSVNHKSMPTLSLEEASKEITELHNYVKENYGYEMYLFRPPMGEFSEQTLALAQSLGYRTMLWSYAYKDYDTENQPPITEAYNKVTAATHGGAVYLLHAVSATNTALLGDAIDFWRAKGYQVGAYPR